ncbi:MAG: hypothetical protein GC181_06845 [Bacteroidetes bacterium]|nr:hypothetical protein [Bacteroidota bacterium]
MKQSEKILFILFLIAGTAGRIWSAWVNNESNDDHVAVVLRILAHEKIDHRDSCWECFQPPLFYKAHAGLSVLTGASSRRELIQQMQESNVLISLITVLVIFLTLKRLRYSERFIRYAMVFSLICPAFFGVGIQGTNDTIVILLATISFSSILIYLREKQIKWILSAGIFSAFAFLFKGSGLAVFLLFNAWLVFFSVKDRKWMVLSVPLLALLYLFQFSHYKANYERYGNAFQTNLDVKSLPPFFDDGNDFYARPGISSIDNSFLRFRLFDMLKKPYNINVNEGKAGIDFPKHRTSFWSQLYGSFWDVQFLQHPFSWESKQPTRLWIVRLLFIFGLIPAFILVKGHWEIIRNIRISNIKNSDWAGLFSISIFLGMLAFNAKYAYDYRDFGCIKAIFILPALFPMLLIFYRGWKLIKSVKWKLALNYVLLFLFVLMTIDIVALSVRLTKIAYGFLKIV